MTDRSKNPHIRDTNGRTLLANLIVAERMFDRMRGLIGRQTLPSDTGMLILPCRSIHMLFMRFPIDAIFLDSHFEVLAIAENLRPWRIASAPRKTCAVLETSAGFAAQNQVVVGQKLIMG